MSGTPQSSGSEPHIDVEALLHHTELPHTKISRVLDRFVKGVGDLVSWLWVVLVLVIVSNVTLRYAFGRGYIELEEAQWHIYAIGWLIGLSYCVQNDSHIRIDILHDRFRLRTKAWVDFLGILFFLIPYTFIVLRYSPEWIAYSYQTGEISDAPGGLAHRWAIKAVMFIAYAILMIAAISRLSRAAAVLFGGKNTISRD